MRERVIPLDGYPLRAPALNGKDEGVIGTSVSVVTHNNIGIVLTSCRILQIQNAQLVGVSDRRSSGTVVYRVRTYSAIQAEVLVCIVYSEHYYGRLGLAAVQQQ